MKIAFILCGTPRTFVFREQINYFKKLKSKFPDSDFYILLRIPKFKNSPIQQFKHGNPYIEHYIQTEQGLNNLQEQINNLKPIYYQAFTDFNNSNEKECCYLNQWKMINKLLEEAHQYAIRNNFEYTHYIRFRLEWTDINLYLNNELVSKLNNKFVYTSVKDCEDILFILSNHLYQNWWIPNINQKYKILQKKNESLFGDIPVKKIYISDGGLLRDYNIISFWGKKEKLFNHNLFWHNFNLLEYQALNKIYLDREKYYEKINLLFQNNYNYYLLS